MAGKERPERSSIALHHQCNKATRTITKLPIRNSWTIVISWYWICDIRYMIYDVWYMMCAILYDIWYVMHMLICSSPTITLCCSHLRWVGMPDMGRLGFSRWVTSKKSVNFFGVHHDSHTMRLRNEASRVRNHLPSIFKSSSTLLLVFEDIISQSLPSWLGSLSLAQPLEEELMCLACRWDFADLYDNCHGSFSYVSLSYLFRDWILKMLLISFCHDHYPVQD